MTRRAKVELFEQIRREYEIGVGTMAGVTRKFGAHRRRVRQAIKSAIPPSRKMPQRNSPALDPVRDFIDQILIDDQKAPRKQRHTAHRIYERLCADFSNHPVAERTVREYVQFWKLTNGKARGEIDRKSTRLNSSHLGISYAVFCLKKKKYKQYNRFNH